MNKEEEEFIKERERNRELMEEIAREIEMTCSGKLKKKEKKLTMIITIVKTLDEQVPSGELRAFFDSLTLLGVFYMEQCIFCIYKATYPLSLTHLVGKQRI